jgi:superfamily II DNA/RNA helicase
MQSPEVIVITGKTAVAPDISHMCFYAEQRDKIEVLRKLVGLVKAEQALVFINRSHDIENVVAKLSFHGLKVAGIYGSSVKLDRQKSLENFRNGKVQLLVASDLAARGLDIPGVAYIFNLDMPEDSQVYLHRVGRTGRAGQSGTAVSIVADWEVGFIDQYEKDLKIDIAAKHMSGGRIMDAPKRKPSEKAPKR